MRESIGLAAYRSLSGRRAVPAYAPAHPRPSGEVVWIHAAEAGNNRAIADLAQRLITVRHGTHVVLTATEGGFDPFCVDGILVDAAPEDHPATARAFIHHWQPDVVIWAWGDLQPNLVHEADRSGAHMLLVDAASDGFDGRRDRWLPDVPRRLLGAFDHVIARDADSRARLIQLGRPASRVELAAPLHPSGRMLLANDSDIADVTEALAGRPTWLAAQTTRAEERVLLGAHKLAVSTSHRLLLILHATSAADSAHSMDLAHAAGMRAVYWGEGQLPDDNCQVLVADADDELGLWLRIAPVTFLGGSMHPGNEVYDPYIAASHGTALIYGPHVGKYGDAFARLVKARAARMVNDKKSLGRAVSQMTAPDQAAMMAMAGWDVVTQAALSLDRVIDLTQSHLDAIDGGAA
ncbi:glycosyltransferase N-terminal domain-containing protein [uncultured Tateyamaria sp.]|uniref:3-deoxy-D-manno-octulosonic acid transferase n=1 Tax=uncultured Tateyamaria sp. TaxID=455651 RepID=UPI0026302E90|nr:glycosyltransferase N-terminal domain-containing protein [uncultured Tateyamaria sp.]